MNVTSEDELAVTVLEVEIWKIGEMDRSSCVGRIVFTGTELMTMFNTKNHVWNDFKMQSTPGISSNGIPKIHLDGKPVSLKELDANKLCSLFPVTLETYTSGSADSTGGGKTTITIFVVKKKLLECDRFNDG